MGLNTSSVAYSPRLPVQLPHLAQVFMCTGRAEEKDCLESCVVRFRGKSTEVRQRAPHAGDLFSYLLLKSGELVKVDMPERIFTEPRPGHLLRNVLTLKWVCANPHACRPHCPFSPLEETAVLHIPPALSYCLITFLRQPVHFRLIRAQDLEHAPHKPFTNDTSNPCSCSLPLAQVPPARFQEPHRGQVTFLRHRKTEG